MKHLFENHGISNYLQEILFVNVYVYFDLKKGNIVVLKMDSNKFKWKLEVLFCPLV